MRGAGLGTGEGAVGTMCDLKQALFFPPDLTCFPPPVRIVRYGASACIVPAMRHLKSPGSIQQRRTE